MQFDNGPNFRLDDAIEVVDGYLGFGFGQKLHELLGETSRKSEM